MSASLCDESFWNAPGINQFDISIWNWFLWNEVWIELVKMLVAAICRLLYHANKDITSRWRHGGELISFLSL